MIILEEILVHPFFATVSKERVGASDTKACDLSLLTS
jgi:hypothetical protein